MKFAANAVFVLLSFAVASSQGRLTGAVEEHKKINGVLVDVFEEDAPEAEVKGKDRKLDFSMENRDRLMESENLLTMVKSLLAKQPMFLQDIEEQRKVVEAARAEMRNIATDIVEMAISEYNAPVDAEVENTVVEELCFGTFLLEMLDGFVDDAPLAQAIPTGEGLDCTEDEDCMVYGLVCADTYTCSPEETDSCEDDYECGSGMACDEDTFTCYPTLSDPVISNGMGEEPDYCEEDYECGSGMACDRDTYKCYATVLDPIISTTMGGDIACEDDFECGAGMACDFDTFTCYQTGLGLDCTDDLDCTDGLVCSEVSYTCALDSISNALGEATFCEEDDECGSGMVCDKDTYTCYPDMYALEGQGPLDCAVDGECPEGFTCDKDQLECYPDTEAPDEGAGLDEYCASAEVCAPGLTCDVVTYVCILDLANGPGDTELDYGGDPPGPAVDFGYLTNPNSTIPVENEEGGENEGALIDPFEEDSEQESPPGALVQQDLGEGGVSGYEEPVPDADFIDEMNDPDGNAADSMYDY